MQILVSEVAKYIILIITSIYTYLGFIEFLKDRKNNTVSIFQPFLIILFHFMGFLCIFLINKDLKTILLYLSQVILFIISTFLYIKFYEKLSRVLFFHMQFLIMVGFVFITRLNFVSGLKKTVFTYLALGCCLILPFLIKKVAFLRNMGYLYAIAGILALGFVLLKAKTLYGAKNWIKIFGIRLQPSEFVKILLIFMIASLLYNYKSLKQVIITTVLTAVMVIILVLSRDLGGALIYFTTFVIMVYSATNSKKLLALFTCGGVVSSILGYFIFSHVRVRVQAFLDPWKYIDNKGYQVTQSLFGIGTGGWFGFGLGNGLPKNTPVVESDFIFSGISEEFGLLFGFCIILIYICTIFAIILLAWRTKDKFHRLVSIGCVTIYSFQTFLSIGGTIRFIPSTGVTLPFISQGGSSIISTIIIFGIIQGLYIGEKSGTKQLRKSMSLVYTTFLISAGMIGYLTYFQFAIAPKIMNNPYNKRTDIYASFVSRGKILSSDGKVLAYTKENNGKSVRVYPYRNMYSHFVGRNKLGKTGVEAIMNYELLTSSDNIFKMTFERLNNVKNKGDTVVTTVDSRFQMVLDKALVRGAGVVIEPDTGKILAMVSKPDYDPNNYFANKSVEDARLVNRAISGLYPPGSTFKLLTALEYINENKNYEKFKFNCKGDYVSSGESISCYNHTKHGEEDLKRAFANSCNGAFGSIGLGLNKEKYKKLTEKFLFNKYIQFPLNTSRSSFVLRQSSSVEEILQTSIGQGKTLVTPLHNALIVSAIANRGLLMKPYLIEKVVSYDNKNKIREYEPEKYTTFCSKKNADVLKSFMKAVVTEGTAKKLSWLGFNVYGKTGTAEYNKEDGKKGEHSWFVGFAENKGKKIAVSIVVEDSRGYTGTDVAKRVFEIFR